MLKEYLEKNSFEKTYELARILGIKNFCHFHKRQIIDAIFERFSDEYIINVLNDAAKNNDMLAWELLKAAEKQ